MAHNRIHERNQATERAIRNADQAKGASGGAVLPDYDAEYKAGEARRKRENAAYMKKWNKAHPPKRPPKGESQKARERGVGGKGTRYL